MEPPSDSLDVRVRTEGAATVVSAVGDIDIQTVPVLSDALAKVTEEGATRLVVDLDGVGFLDSSGLGALVGANKRVRAQGGTMVLVSSAEKVVKLFRITRLTELLRIYDSVDAAVAGD